MSPSPAPEAHEAALAEVLATRCPECAHRYREHGDGLGCTVRPCACSVTLASVLADHFTETVTEARAEERLLLEYAESLPDWRDFSKREIRAWLRARADSLAPEAPSEERVAPGYEHSTAETPCAHCGLTFAQHDNNACVGDWSIWHHALPAPVRGSEAQG